MRYNYNGRDINIPDEELEQNINVLELTREQAIEVWLEDNGYRANSTVEELTKKAKENKTDKIVAKSDKPRAKRVVVHKENPIKAAIVAAIAETLSQYEGVERLNISNKEKIIEFYYEDKEFKLDLIQRRKKE